MGSAPPRGHWESSGHLLKERPWGAQVVQGHTPVSLCPKTPQRHSSSVASPGLHLRLSGKGHFSSLCLKDIFTEKMEPGKKQSPSPLTWTQVFLCLLFKEGNCSDPVSTHDIIHDLAFLGWVFLSSGWHLANLSYPISSGK